ncbi:MAG TPA: threonine/serine dehydratase [Chitinophagaceae bacterium]|jgi:threonine dehydratase|nr:threonine/serine dehydratase [Chitinophagaceae bacterium]
MVTSQKNISVSLQDIRDAQQRIAGKVNRTPLIRFYPDNFPGEIYLKLENLQPIGSFKLRGAYNAMNLADKSLLAEGVYTASAGNMAQGVAWNARAMNIPCTVIVPDHAPQTKLDAITRLGAKFIKIPFNDWWQVLVTRKFEGMKGLFVHPVSDPPVIAGNGTVGLEILEDCPDVDAVIVPYGGGGLISGIASAIKAIKPEVKIFASEVETAAPLAPSLAAGQPVKVEYIPSFVDGMGSGGILEEMWPLVSKLVNGSIVLSLKQIADTIKLLMERNRVIAEGAGGSSPAAALTGKAGTGKIVCVISGGNIDAEKLIKILSGTMV